MCACECVASLLKICSMQIAIPQIDHFFIAVDHELNMTYTLKKSKGCFEAFSIQSSQLQVTNILSVIRTFPSTAGTTNSLLVGNNYTTMYV